MSDQIEFDKLYEAPASATVRIDSANGLDWMLTIRDLTVSGLLKKIEVVEGYLLDKNWGEHSMPAVPPVDNTPPPPPTNGNGNGTHTPPPVSPSQEQQLTFQAEALSANMNDGTTYWKVKGGRFSKYGITIWPEVLKAVGFYVEELDVTQQYDLSEYTAYYVLNDNGNPSKVTSLVKNR